jgi:hypothetical protein
VTLTRRQIAALFALEGLAFALLVFALLDRRLHQSDPANGINQWGYRGAARGERQPGEIRVALLGGSAAFEAGTTLEQTMANNLLYQLQEAGRPSGQEYSIVNLSEPRVSADSYADTLRAYEFLDPDVVVVFDGYDAIAGLPQQARRQSLVFRAVGYLPILPARILGRRAWLSDPEGGVLDMLKNDRAEPADVGCDGASKAYCAAMAETVRHALQRGYPIVVASPPFVSERHAAQQRSLGAALTQEFGGNPRFLYLDLGAAIDLSNRAESRDGIHRTILGNHEAGQRIAVGILRLLARQSPTAPASGSR